MWRPWAKSTVKIRGHSSSSSSQLFTCSSFKDIQSLCKDDFPSSSPSSTSSPSRGSLQHHRHPPFFRRPTVAASPSLLRTRSSPITVPEPETQRIKPQPEPEPEPVHRGPSPRLVSIPGVDQNRIVVYFTSLRVVRSTFEDCRDVRLILRGFRLTVDERDLSMDSGFMSELQAIMGGIGAGKPTLPQVFIGGRYIGGAEEVRQLHEAGELKKYVEGLPPAEAGVCDACGGHRFLLCMQCDGSHKVYAEKGGFRTCTACNENGLVRCPSCSFAPP